MRFFSRGMGREDVSKGHRVQIDPEVNECNGGVIASYGCGSFCFRNKKQNYVLISTAAVQSRQLGRKYDRFSNGPPPGEAT